MSEEKKYMVYCHTNKINGKRYVGMTGQKTLKYRSHNGASYKGCRYFYFAIRKYGWDNFDHEILESGLSLDEAKQVEMTYIREFRTRDHRYGYNIDTGGGVPNVLSPEGYASLVESTSGGNNPHAIPVVVFDSSGKKINEFDCIRDAENFYGLRSLYSPVVSGVGTRGGLMFRKKKTFGCYEQLPEHEIYKPHEQRLVRGENSWHSTPVTLFNSSSGVRVGDFGCMKHAEEFAGVSLSAVFRGVAKSANGYLCFPSDKVQGIDVLPAEYLPKYDRHFKEVLQFDKSGRLISTFPSLQSAASETGTSYKTLSMCVRHKVQTAGGFVWRLSSDSSPFVKPKTAAETLRERGDPKRRPVDKLDLLSGSVIETYSSITEAASANNTNKSNIWNVVAHKGGCVSCAGFGWKYHDE